MAKKKTEEITEEVAEAVSNPRLVTLTKDGVSFTVSSQIQVSAFLASGYEVEE